MCNSEIWIFVSCSIVLEPKINSYFRFGTRLRTNDKTHTYHLKQINKMTRIKHLTLNENMTLSANITLIAGISLPGDGRPCNGRPHTGGPYIIPGDGTGDAIPCDGRRRIVYLQTGAYTGRPEIIYLEARDCIGKVYWRR